jgi:glycosyltransferase involved in cell wall biosynthesis
VPSPERGTVIRRVLMTTDTVGGVWSYALELARGLSRHDVETTLAVLGPAPREEQRAEARSIPGLALIETELPLDWDPDADADQIAETGATLADIASDVRAEIIHLNSPVLASRAPFPAPVVGVCHSCLATWWRAVKGSAPMPPDFIWRTDLLREGYRHCDVLVAPSDSFARATAEVHRLGEQPIVVHNGRAEARPTAHLRPNVSIFTAGRLWDEGKNAKVLDRAAAKLNIPIHAAGPISSPNGDNVFLEKLQPIGWLADHEIAGWFAVRPIFVSVALYEPFGLAVLEAARAGCPLVLSDIPTFRELWDDAAVFVPAEDDVTIAGALRNLLDNQAEQRRLGELAAKRAADYAPERMADRMLSIYSGLAASRMDAPSRQTVS